MGLMSVEELAGRLDDPALVICDVRFYLDDHGRGRREYDAAHLPGARFVDLHTELADSSVDGAGRHPLPDIATFGELVGRLGIGPSSFVVAYDAAGGAIASRLWWMLRSAGHPNVAVLDGGIDAWRSAGLPETTEVPEPTPAEFPTPSAWAGVVTADDIADQGMRVVDSRSPERYRGEHEPIDPRAGHIPGAVNLFHGDTLDADGSHRSTAELAEHFAAADLGEDPVVYCGSGVTACHNLLAMSIAGIPGARLYPGSWSEWSGDPTRPVATS